MTKQNMAVTHFEANNRNELYKRLKEIRMSIGSQEYVAKLLNQGQESISRYENGNRIPHLSYISKLAREAQLPFTEEQYLLGLAGGVISTRMPSSEQIKKGLEAYCLDIQSDWYPCLIVDHNFGIWVSNKAASDILGENKTLEIIGEYVTIFESLFSSMLEYDANSSVYEVITSELNSTRLQQITFFKLFNIQRRHEAFYRNYPKHLGYIRSGQARIHEEEFALAWDKVDVVSKSEFNIKEGIVEFRGVLPAKELVDVVYRQRLESIPHLPMFGIIRYEPFYEYYHLFEIYKQSSNEIIKLWEIAAIEPIIEGIDRLNLLGPIKDKE